jgi:hypothetical protein
MASSQASFVPHYAALLLENSHRSLQNQNSAVARMQIKHAETTSTTRVESQRSPIAHFRERAKSKFFSAEYLHGDAGLIIFNNIVRKLIN